MFLCFFKIFLNIIYHVNKRGDKPPVKNIHVYFAGADAGLAGVAMHSGDLM